MGLWVNVLIMTSNRATCNDWGVGGQLNLKWLFHDKCFLQQAVVHWDLLYVYTHAKYIGCFLIKTRPNPKVRLRWSLRIGRGVLGIV
jgi:hypothetical protein